MKFPTFLSAITVIPLTVNKIASSGVFGPLKRLLAVYKKNKFSRNFQKIRNFLNKFGNNGKLNGIDKIQFTIYWKTPETEATMAKKANLTSPPFFT